PVVQRHRQREGQLHRAVVHRVAVRFQLAAAVLRLAVHAHPSCSTRTSTAGVLVAATTSGDGARFVPRIASSNGFTYPGPRSNTPSAPLPPSCARRTAPNTPCDSA